MRAHSLSPAWGEDRRIAGAVYQPDNEGQGGSLRGTKADGQSKDLSSSGLCAHALGDRQGVERGPHGISFPSLYSAPMGT